MSAQGLGRTLRSALQENAWMCCLSNAGASRGSPQRLRPVPRARPRAPLLGPEPIPSSEDQGLAVSGSASDPAACQLLTFPQRLCSRCFTEKCDVLASLYESRAATFPSTGTSLRGGDVAAPPRHAVPLGLAGLEFGFPQEMLFRSDRLLPG